MARDKRPGDQLMQCPNYKVCGTYVRASQRGRPHRYGVLVKGEIQYRDCPGG